MELRRRINAWILLGLFVPMLITASLHRHEPAGEQQEVCSDCIRHVAHGEHLSSGLTYMADCIFCQFLNYNFTTATALSVVALVISIFILRPTNDRSYAFSPTHHHSSRAPPFLL